LARSVTCRYTRIEVPEETIRIWVLDNGLSRSEEKDGSYTISNSTKYRALVVNPRKREATLFEGANIPQVNMYERIKRLPGDASARPLPRKKIDGKEALGFLVKMEGHDVTVWADPTTRLPVRIEAEEKDSQGKTVGMVLHEFVFDKELDSKLFSFDTKLLEGYKIETKGIANFPAAPTDPQQKDLVVTPLVGIGPVKFGMSREEVERLLGKPDGVQEVGNRGAVNLNYGSRGFFLFVSKTLGVITISCVAQKSMAFRVRDFTGKTDKGIALGVAKADIIRAYGEPNRNETQKGSTYLSYGKLQADFTLFDDKLVEMMFQRPRPAK
jgi:hypothetical protein